MCVSRKNKEETRKEGEEREKKEVTHVHTGYIPATVSKLEGKP